MTTLQEQLAEAVELAEDAMSYVPEYFANKHGMFRRMAALKEAHDSRSQPAEVPPEIAAIIERLHTQDNRITDNPLFAVQQKRRVYGLDEDYEAAHGWFHPDRDSLVVEGGPEFAELEAAWESGEEPEGGWRRVGFKDTWEFVTGCLTEQGCKGYIACNGHNLHEPRIYAYGSYRNAEFIALRKWLMSLAASPQAAPAQTQQAPAPQLVALTNADVVEAWRTTEAARSDYGWTSCEWFQAGVRFAQRFYGITQPSQQEKTQ